MESANALPITVLSSKPRSKNSCFFEKMSYHNIMGHFNAKTSVMDMEVLEKRHVFAHNHRTIELFYLIDGEMTCLCGENEIQICKGDFFIIPEMEKHAFSANKKVLYLQIHVNRNISRQYADSDCLVCAYEDSRKSNVANQKTRRLLNKLLTLYLSNGKEFELLLQSAYYELLYHIIKSYHVKQEDVSDVDRQRKKKMQCFIEENYSDTITLNDLADYMNLSRVYISKYFKRLFKSNFFEYLIHYRLMEAHEEMVLNPKRSVAQVALDNGFPNLKAFYKAFKDSFGMSPSDYRSQREEAAKKDAEDLRRGKEMLIAYRKSEGSFEGESEKEDTIKCDISAAGDGVAYTKACNKVINIGRISNLLRSDFQRHILVLSKGLGFWGVRVWDIYSDDLHIRSSSNSESYDAKYDFSVMDRIFDFLVENGLKPYIDIGNKPNLLWKSVNHALINEESRNVFLDMGVYVAFLKRFLEHYLHRYGIVEMSGWYFELWFDYTETKESAAALYEKRFCTIYEVIHSYIPQANVGGLGDNPSPLLKMPEVMKRLDFVSVYSYPIYDVKTDTPFSSMMDKNAKDDLLDNKVVLRDDYLDYRIENMAEYLKKTNDAKLHITEWNFSISNRNVLNDSVYKAAYIVKNCIHTMGGG